MNSVYVTQTPGHSESPEHSEAAIDDASGALSSLFHFWVSISLVRRHLWPPVPSFRVTLTDIVLIYLPERSCFEGRSLQ